MNHLADTDNILLYHLSVLMLHLINVFLLNIFLKKFNTILSENAFWLTLFFAIHPALTMAVAWIPGVNDILFTTFALLYFIQFIKLSKAEKVNFAEYFIFIVLFFLALFTKETGLFLPLGTALIYWYIHPKLISIKQISFISVLLFFVLILWYLLRKTALVGVPSANFSGESIHIFLKRLPGVIQYFGKSILPFQLNVWPLIGNTNFYQISIALLVIIGLLFFNKSRNIKSIIFGLGWMLLFLIPTFFSTTTIFVYHEHRLYFPIIGILFIINQTVFFASAQKNILMMKRIVMCLIATVFLYQIHQYIPVFNDAISFQKNALEASPNDAYLNSTYGFVLSDNQQPQQALPYLRKALSLDSTLKNVRLFITRYNFIPNKKYDSAKIFMLDEINRTPKFADNYYALSTIGFETKDYLFCEKYLDKYIQLRPDNLPIQQFALTIYIQNKHYEKANKLAKTLIQNNERVDDKLYQSIQDSLKLFYAKKM
jgi:hypothetical protein